MNEVALSHIKCPNCKGTGCGFCKETGIIYYYPSVDALDYIEIAYRKFKIKHRG